MPMSLPISSPEPLQHTGGTPASLPGLQNREAPPAAVQPVVATRGFVRE